MLVLQLDLAAMTWETEERTAAATRKKKRHVALSAEEYATHLQMTRGSLRPPNRQGGRARNPLFSPELQYAGSRESYKHKHV